MTEHNSLRVVKQYIDALAEFDLDTLGRCVAENFVFELPTAPAMMPKNIEGRREFLEFFGGASAMWSSFRLTHCELYLAANDPGRVFLEYRSEAVNVDGSIYRNTYVSRAIVHDGVVSRYCEMMDPEPVADALTKLRRYSVSAIPRVAKPDEVSAAVLYLEPNSTPTGEELMIENIEDFRALDPFLRTMAEGLRGLVDGESFFDMLADDVVFDFIITVPDYPRHVVGRENLIELFRGYRHLFMLDRCYDLCVHHDPVASTVVLEYSSEGTAAATGYPYANRYISVAVIENRKIVQWRDYLDPLRVFAALEGRPFETDPAGVSS